MSVNGKLENIELADLQISGKTMSLTAAKIREAIDRVREAQQQWRSFAIEAELTQQEAERIEHGFVHP